MLEKTPRLQKILKRGMVFGAITMFGIATTAITPLSATAQSNMETKRAKAFSAAAKEFGVPESLLLAISYNQTRWENYEGKPSAMGGYGLMHLTTSIEVEDGRGDPNRPLKKSVAALGQTLNEAAGLLQVSPEALKKDDTLNVRGGAALLAKYAKEANHGQLPSSLEGWTTAVGRLSSTSTAQGATDFTESVNNSIKDGIGRVTGDGQRLSLQATSGKGLNLDSVKALGLPGTVNDRRSNETECPQTVTCKYVPAYYGQNNPDDKKDYGNLDVANRPKDMDIKYIVIHDTEGSYQSAIDWFQNPASYVAANYVIRSSDGEVTQMVKNKDVGWHAGNWYMNMHSIGIEHEGFAADGAAWYTEAMYQSSAKLVRHLADKYNIPLDREHIVGHDQYHGISPERAKKMHTDPGPYWDWEYYMSLVKGSDNKTMSSNYKKHHNAVTITPKFATNKPLVTDCKDGVCVPLPTQSANFVYLRTEPRDDAPLLTDAGLHPDGAAGTTEVEDWSAKATHGQTFAVAERKNDWTAVWFGGQKGWFANPKSEQHTVSTKSKVITPKKGKTSIPVYGRPMPEESAFKKKGVPLLTPVPLQYSVLSGQKYVAYDSKATNDYYHVLTFDYSTAGELELVMGKDKYIPISYNHRQAFVKASDVDISLQ